MVTARILDNFYTFGIDFAVQKEYERMLRKGYSKKTSMVYADRLVQQALCSHG